MPERQPYLPVHDTAARLRFLESILEKFSDSILVIEAHHTGEPTAEPGPQIVYANESFTRATGYEPQEVIGKTPSILHGPKTDQAQLEKIHSGFSKEEPVEVALLCYRKDGAEFLADVSLLPVGGVPGKTTHFVWVQRETISRKATEQKLWSNNSDLGTMLESITDAFFALDKEWRFTYVNAEAERVLDRKREDLIGKNVWDEFPEAVNLSFYQEYNRAVDEQRTVKFEEFYPPLDTWVEITAYPSEAGLSVYFREINERKRMETELKESEERLRAILVQYASDIITIVEADGTISYESPAVEQTLGYKPEERIGKSIFAFVHPEDVEQISEEFVRLLEGGGVSPYVEVRIRHTDGTWRDLEAIGNNLLDDPQVKGIVINSRDVTERKKAETKLKESERRLTEAQQLARIGNWEMHIPTNSTIWSEELYRICGLEPRPEESVPFETFASLIHPEDAERVWGVIDEVFKDPQPFVYDHRIVRPDGEVRSLHVQGEALCNEAGGVERIVGTMQDVTELRRAEAELKENYELLQSVMEGTTDAVFVKDLQGRYLTINQAGAQALGKSVEEVIGKDDTELFDTEDARGVMEEDQKILAEEETRTTEDNKTAEGQTRTFLSTKGPYRDGQGNVAGMFGVARDITERKSSEEALRRSERRLAAAQRMAHVGNWEQTIGGDLYWSDELYRIYGFTPQQFVPTYEDAMGVIHPDDREYIDKVQDGIRRSGGQSTVECRIVRPDGEVRFVQNAYEMDYDEAGGLTRIAGTVQDITVRKWEEKRRATQYEVTRILAEAPTLENAAPEILEIICENLEWEVGGFWVVDQEAGVLYPVQTWKAPTIEIPEFIETSYQTTFSLGEGLPGRVWESGELFWVPDISQQNLPRVTVALNEGLRGGFGFPILLGEKVLGVMEFFGREVRQRDEEIIGLMNTIGNQVGQFIERKRFEEQLQHQALHDDLTDLPNRTLFTDRLGHALDRAKRSKKSIGVLFLDLDNFKYINDSLGHDVGDRLLVGTAKRLKECLRPEDTATRLGGDEFAVLLEEIERPGEAERVAQRILNALSSPFELETHRQFVSASVGIVVTGGSGGRVGDLLRNADLAMYKAKAAGKNRYAVFDPETERRSMQRLELENDLRQALERDEFKVHYQPLVLLETGEIMGMEALARWEHPRRGLVTPDEFIPIMEETGLIDGFGERMLRAACRQASAWQERYPQSPPTNIGVNLSAKQLQNTDLIDTVKNALRETGLNPQSLTLEITESMLVDGAKAHIATLTRLKDLGVRFALDDFGTGYSSLSYLRHIPAGMLKIDGSIVEHAAKASEDQMLLRGIIDIAHGLNFTVVAEKVETAEQAAQLEYLGCDLAQGWYFSGPLPAEEAETILSERASLS